MAKKTKMDYKKPELTKVNLDAKTAVLGGCKVDTVGGPDGSDCNYWLGGKCIEATS